MSTLEELEQLAAQGTEALDARLLPVEAGLAGYPEVVLDESDSLKLRQGQRVRLLLEPAIYMAKSRDGGLLALAEAHPDGTLRSLRGFNLGSSDPSI
jgi:tRNA pseudouridine55 synthase